MTDANLGSWAGSDFESVALANIGLGVDASLPPRERFVRGVAKLVQRRGDSHATAEISGEASVFLLLPRPPEHPATAGAQREPMLNSGRIPINGRIWFVNPPVVAGTFIERPAGSDDELFRLITDELGLGAVPAVIHDPAAGGDGELRFYPAGLDDPDTCAVWQVAFGHVDLTTILTCVDRAYGRFLKTPGAQERAAKVWTSHRPPRSHDDAEARVQVVLAAELHGALWTCHVRTEQPGPAGRLDIIVEEVDPSHLGRVTRHAVLELKVLRGIRMSGAVVPAQFNADHIQSGVEQAAAYRAEMHAAAAALCCFDMRPGGPHDCFAPVLALAATHAVALKCWYLFPSARAFQRHEARA